MYEIRQGMNQADIRTYLERLAEVERKQMVQRQEHRQMLESLMMEQKRQAIIIEQLDERVTKLEYRMSEAERVLAHYVPMVEGLKEKAHDLDLKVWWFEKKGLPCEGYKTELRKTNEKIFQIEGKISKAKFDRDQAELKLKSMH